MQSVRNMHIQPYQKKYNAVTHFQPEITLLKAPKKCVLLKQVNQKNTAFQQYSYF